MKDPAYSSGVQVLAGDRIRYHGEDGYVDFVICRQTGDPAKDWYLDEFPGGGAMLVVDGFGSLFLGIEDIDETLEFVSRA